MVVEEGQTKVGVVAPWQRIIIMKTTHQSLYISSALLLMQNVLNRPI